LSRVIELSRPLGGGVPLYTGLGPLPLYRTVDLATVVVDACDQAREQRRLDLILAACGPLAGRAVLIRTGWDRRWGTAAYWEPGPYLGSVTVQQLVHARPALVGVDFWSLDDLGDRARPATSQLRGAGIPTVEHLIDLCDVTVDARTFVVPVSLQGAHSVTVRAFALV
jgi:kynurenine formamidase